MNAVVWTTKPNIELICHRLDFLKTLCRPLDLVCNQLTVKVHRKYDKNDKRRNNNHRWDNRRTVAVSVEPNPCEDRHLNQEQQDADACGWNPRHFHVATHAVVWRFLNCSQVMNVANGFNVWQDASADHQCKKVYGHNECRAYAECYQQTFRYIFLQLYFNHGNLTIRNKHQLQIYNRLSSRYDLTWNTHSIWLNLHISP